MVSYFIGNIDSDVYEEDLYDYLKDASVTPSHIIMYHGRYGSSAKVNFYYTDESKLLSENFWPEGITFRKWLNMTEWDKEYGQKRSNSRRQHNTDILFQRQTKW